MPAIEAAGCFGQGRLIQGTNGKARQFHHSLHQGEQLLDVCMKMFRFCDGPSALCLQFGTFELNMQRIDEPVHQPAKRRHRRQFDDLRAVKVPRKLRVRVPVITRLVMSDQFSPPNDCLFTSIEQRTVGIVIAAECIELFFSPARRSPDRAIMFDSVTALVNG